MKKIIAWVFVLFITKILTAQMPSVALDTSDKKYPFTGTTKNNLLTGGIFSHATARGKVYTLPYDNMPCLVPDMNQVSRMPVLIQKMPDNRMPNATPLREMIPKEKER